MNSIIEIDYRSGRMQIPTKSPADSEMMSPGVPNDVAWLAGVLLAVDFWQSWGWWSILWGRSDASASQTLAGEIDAMGVVNEAVEDGVGVSRVAEHGAMPQ